MSDYCIIPDNCHNFWSFIDNLPLTDEYKEIIKNGRVAKVQIDTKRGTWAIFLTVSQKLPGQMLQQIEKYLCKACNLSSVNFVQEVKELQTYLQRDWEEFIDKIAESNQAVRQFLLPAHHEFDGQTLTIDVVSHLSVEMLKERDVDQTIKKIVKQEFGIFCKVKFINSTPEPQKFDHEEDLMTPEYMEALTGNTTRHERKEKESPIILGRNIKDESAPIGSILEEDRNVVIEGEITNLDQKEFRTGKQLLAIDVADETGGISCKVFFKEQEKEKCEKVAGSVQKGMFVKVKGTVQSDKFSYEELVMYPDSIVKIEKEERLDTAETTRVELHLHTRMSNMDSVVSVKQLIETAVKWGHPAVAITDHGVVQAFPEAYDEAHKHKDKIKIIYGMEGYLIDEDVNHARHIVILAKNTVGLKNLYRMVSLSHLKFFHRKPRIPRTVLEDYREGLLLGSACEAGELIQAIVRGEPEAELERIAAFYDYLEIQPIGNNAFLVREGKVADDEGLRQINSKVCELGKKLNKLVVATCDVHFFNPDDSIYRAILMAGQGYSDADKQPPLFFRTTEEMLKEFDYLGEKKAYEVVVENTRKINDLVESFKPIPDELYSPQIPGAEEQIKSMSYGKAKEWYGENIPPIVADRLKLELDSIITHGFSVLYLIAHKLVKKSMDDGYLVGSRGSVGSSFVATMTGITEVNPLPPHWRCPKCKHSEFITDGSYGGGFDMPDKECPHCGILMIKDGHDIPFAVFLGINGDKVPDIDLNFSGDYQPVAHKYTEELFGRDNVFRAGTIATIADKTAYGFVKKYCSEKGINPRNAYINKLTSGCAGVKRTTGQHPAGIMVVPRDMDVHYFTPIQRPADKTSSNTITTHFDYHSISSRLVKLDILGHDDPTVIKMLEDLTGLDAKTFPFDDLDTMSLFSSTKAIQVTPEELGSKVATFGIPEFGTKFVRQMLEDTKPANFSELVRISGFSHGTNVWLNNAQDLIRNGTAKLSEAISARDDIMLYLIHKGIEPKLAFTIMEMVRKGKGKKIPEDDIQKIKDKGVPDWYIESCRKIEYMFPKAHAVAYVMMAIRIAYCKVHYPLAFYASYFTIRATEFDAELIVKGKDVIRSSLKEFEQKGNDLSAKEKGLQTILEVSLEMYLRGFNFYKVDLYQSDATKFIIKDNGLLIPLAGLQGVGDVAAKNIMQAREERAFSSIEDLRIRGHISKTVVDILKEHGCLEGLSETDQMMLFA